MADSLSPSPAKPTARRGYAFVIAVAGALLVFCAFLPWTGIEARLGAIGGVSNDIRGIDDSLGVYALIAGIATLALGVAGVFGRPRVAALAVIPGAVATIVLVMFVVDPPGVGNGVSVDLGFLSIEPGIRYGWFAALACALAAVALAVLSLVRGRQA